MAADAEARARVKALLAEFDQSIAPQKIALVAMLPDIWSATYGQTPIMPTLAAAPAAAGMLAGPKAGAAAGIKREGGPLAAQPDTKRPRSAETQRKIDAIFKLCHMIVSKKLWSAKSASWFKERVDPAMAINYYQIIKEPMDLGLVKKRLQENYYATPYDFKYDVDLVWSNCAAYNQLGTPVRKAGDSCKAIWERAWREAGIEQQWQQIQYELDPSGAPLGERLHALTQQLSQVLESVPGPSQGEDRSRPMTFAQKRRLSTRLSTASPELAHRVLEIVAEDPAAATGASGVEGTEVELDLDQLSPDTLWRLRDLLDRPGGGGGAIRPTMVAAAGVAPVPQQGRPMMAGKTPAPGGGGMAMGARGGMDMNGRATSMVSSGVASESGSGEGGGHNSQDNKGSTLDGPRQGGFVRDSRQVVDESATAPKEQSQFVRDRAAARKGDVAINSAHWDLSSDVGPSDAPQAAPQGEPEGDDVWKSFQSMAEQKQQREDEQRREAEAAEAKKREERDRARREEEERQQRLRDEEERQAAEQQKQRDAQMHKELEEMRAQAGTANLTQHSDLASLAGLTGLGAQGGHGEGLEALGLQTRDDDDDMNFDDDE